MKVFGLFQKLNTSNALKNYDSLYEKTIVHLPKESRLHYCKNLIACCEDELSEVKNKKKRKELEILILASTQEISLLETTE